MSDEIIEKLIRLKPRVEVSEADLLYQMGWQGAMASNKSTATSGSHRPVWTNFLFGAVSGFAATGLFFLLFDPMRSNQDAGQTDSYTVASSSSLERATNGDGSFDPSTSSSLDHHSNSTLSLVARESWQSLLEERLRGTHSSGTGPSEFLNRESLQSILKSFPGT